MVYRSIRPFVIIMLFRPKERPSCRYGRLLLLLYLHQWLYIFLFGAWACGWCHNRCFDDDTDSARDRKSDAGDGVVRRNAGIHQIYIYIERERERERGTPAVIETHLPPPRPASTAGQPAFLAKAKQTKQHRLSEWLKEHLHPNRTNKHRIRNEPKQEKKVACFRESSNVAASCSAAAGGGHHHNTLRGKRNRMWAPASHLSIL